MTKLHAGDCRTILPTLPAASVQCVVTSPPYWGLRDYGARDQMGLEATPAAYLEAMVAVFRQVRRVLRDDGTAWINMGDAYASGGSNGAAPRLGRDLGDPTQGTPAGWGNREAWGVIPTAVAGLKPKDLIGMPWRLALALQADGWWLRSDCIWAKPNPMPESVTDRPTKAHEYVFLLTKSARYFYDADAVREKVGVETRRAASFRDGGIYTGGRSFDNGGDRTKATHGDGADGTGRNLRSVWTVTPAPCADAHFATFPPALAARCILAGSRVGDTVLDPFAGTGTTGAVAERLGRHSVLVELAPHYVTMAEGRTAQLGLFTQEERR